MGKLQGQGHGERCRDKDNDKINVLTRGSKSAVRGQRNGIGSRSTLSVCGVKVLGK
jgi:hypothetical protein